MKITENYTITEPDSPRTIYIVELSKNSYADVCVKETTGLVYVMQNDDGTERYDPKTRKSKGHINKKTEEKLMRLCYEHHYKKKYNPNH